MAIFNTILSQDDTKKFDAAFDSGNGLDQGAFYVETTLESGDNIVAFDTDHHEDFEALKQAFDTKVRPHLDKASFKDRNKYPLFRSLADFFDNPDTNHIITTEDQAKNFENLGLNSCSGELAKGYEIPEGYVAIEVPEERSDLDQDKLCEQLPNLPTAAPEDAPAALQGLHQMVRDTVCYSMSEPVFITPFTRENGIPGLAFREFLETNDFAENDTADPVPLRDLAILFDTADQRTVTSFAIERYLAILGDYSRSSVIKAIEWATSTSNKEALLAQFDGNPELQENLSLMLRKIVNYFQQETTDFSFDINFEESNGLPAQHYTVHVFADPLGFYKISATNGESSWESYRGYDGAQSQSTSQPAPDLRVIRSIKECVGSVLLEQFGFEVEL